MNIGATAALVALLCGGMACTAGPGGLDDGGVATADAGNTDGQSVVDAPIGGGDGPMADADPGSPDAESPPDADPPDADPPDASPPDAQEIWTVCAAPAGDYTTITGAIAGVPDGATIAVCPGTYEERLVVDARTVRLVGTGGAAVTILDAEHGGSAIVVTGAADFGLDGFTVRNGLASDGGGLRCAGSAITVAHSVFTSNEAAERGGGLYALDCTGSVDDNQFSGGLADEGGGVHVAGGAVAVTDNEIHDNRSRERGGGLYQGSNSLIEGNTVQDNDSDWIAGGIYTHQHAPTLRGNQVLGNSSVNDGGGLYLYQGQPVLIENTIRGNQGGDDGGGVRAFESFCRMERNLLEQNSAGNTGGGARIGHKPCVLIDNTIRDNTAYKGGGLDLDNDSSQVSGGVISGNVASSWGGGIHMYLGPHAGAALTNIRIENNQASSGGGISFEDNYEPIALSGLVIANNKANYGAGMRSRTTEFTLKNSVFYGNQATTRGGAIFMQKFRGFAEGCSPCPSTHSSSTISFVTAWNNSAVDGAAVASDTPDVQTFENSIFYANSGTTSVFILPPEDGNTPVAPVWRYNDTSPATFSGMSASGNGNLAVNPKLVAPASGDFHLDPTSPCVNAADPALQDPDASRADMGRYGGPGGL
jgi:predicted outer membrane repeat protein